MNKLKLTLMLLLLAAPAVRAETHFIIDDSGSKPRGYWLAVDTDSASSECVSTYKSTLFGSKPVGKGYVTPWQTDNLLIGETSQEGWDFGPVLVFRDRKKNKDFIIGRAWDINNISLEEGALIRGNKNRGNILAPGGETSYVEFLADREFPEFTGRILEPSTIDQFISTAEGACESGDSSLGSCDNLKTLIELKKTFEKYSRK